MTRSGRTGTPGRCRPTPSVRPRGPSHSSAAAPSNSRAARRSWSGSLGSKFESRLQLLDQLQIGDHPALQEAFREFRAELVETIAKQRARELEEGRAESERFE